MKASKLFTEQDKKAVNQAIAEAEKATSGELVPVVAGRSGRYDRAEDIFGIILGLVVVALVWLIFQRVETNGVWAPTPSVGLGLVLLAFIIPFLAGVLLASLCPAIIRPMIGKKEMQEETLRAADRAFFDFRVRATKGATGILIYISLLERIVCVIGDEAISKKLEAAHWQEVRDLVLDGLRRGKPTEGICAGVKRCGELLAQHFPIAPDDVNELPNELHVVD